MALDRAFPNQNLKELISKSLLEVFPNSQVLKKIKREWLASQSIYDIMTNRSGLTWSDAILDKYSTSAIFNPQIPPHEALQFNPSMVKKYHYSGVNYFILAELIKEMTKLSFEQALADFINRNSSTYSHALKGPVLEARKHEDFRNLVDDLSCNADNMYLPEGSANIVSTAGDMLRWNDYLYNNLDAKFRDIMMLKSPRDATTDYGLGLIHNKNNDCIWHAGHADSFRSWSGYMRSRDLNIVVLSNDPIRYHALLDIVDGILLG